MSDPGFIYVKNWKQFQHPDVVRSGGVRMPWIRDYVDQLDNDAYLDLPLAYRAGLQDIRRLVAAVGQGRCSARADYLQRRCGWPAGWAQKIVNRLSDEGFIEVRASKAPAPRKRKARTEVEGEGSKEPQKEKRAPATAAPSAAAPRVEEPPGPAWQDAPEGLAKLATVFNRGDLAA